MNRSIRLVLFLLAILGTSLSSTASAQSAKHFEPEPFMPPPGEPIKTIALLTIPEPRGYYLGEGGSGPGSFFFGLAGALAETYTPPNHPEYESVDFHFSAVAERRLTEHLKAAGFSVVSVPVTREKPDLLRDYEALSVPNVDAYLDVVALNVGYFKSAWAVWPFAHKVGPYVSVAARLVSARSKKILYNDQIEYSWSKAGFPLSEGTHVDAPDDHVFKNTNAVKKDLTSADGRGITHLKRGIDVGMRTIVAAFSAYPAVELPQQAGAPTKRSEIRSGQPASTASPFEGITLRPGGSVEAINAEAEAYCGGLNKKSRLIVAPPGNPDYVFQCYQPAKKASPPTGSPKKTIVKAAPEMQEGAGSRVYKVGIFPAFGEFDHGQGPGTPWEEKYAARIFADHIGTNVSSLDLAYSHYDPGLNQPRIYDYSKVWARNKPKLSVIYREAEARRLDAVFIYRGTGFARAGRNIPSGPMPIELYVIDVKQQQVYEQKGDTDALEGMVQSLVSRFLQGQPR